MMEYGVVVLLVALVLLIVAAVTVGVVEVVGVWRVILAKGRERRRQVGDEETGAELSRL